MTGIPKMTFKTLNGKSTKFRITLDVMGTPAGIPTSSASDARARADRGVSSEGLITQVQPAAKAAPTLRVIIALGKFL